MKTLPSHFDGKKFLNLEPRRHGFFALLRWMLTRERGEWRRQSHAGPGRVPPKTSDSLRVTFVNHATFLLQLDGINILTDPIWSERASPFSWIGPRRVRAPGIRFEDLPPIDLVLLSHDHYDHMDIPTLRRLQQRDRPTIFAGLGNRRTLSSHGIEGVVELDWWQESAARSDLWITAVPAQHFSGRTPFDRDRSLWCGFVIEGRNSCVYFAGDTGSGPHIQQIARQFSDIDVAILPIGAYRPRWFMGEVHMSPQQAVLAHLDLRARVSVGSHFGTFPLADDGQDEAEGVLRTTLQYADLGGTQFWVLGFGEGREVSARLLMHHSGASARH